MSAEDRAEGDALESLDIGARYEEVGPEPGRLYEARHAVAGRPTLLLPAERVEWRDRGWRCATQCVGMAVLALLLSGCASADGGGQQLRQAAPAYAPAPARAPGPMRTGNIYRPNGTPLHGAGDAAPHVEAMPRSPNKRVLPSTKEPGLWAADEPRAARRKSPDLPPDVDELLRPQPSPGTPALASCRERVRRAARDSGVEDVRQSLPGINRECLTARLLLTCFLREQAEFSERLRKSPRTPAVAAAVEKQRAEADEVIHWEERVCHGFLTLPLIEEVRATIQAHLERQFRRPEGRR